ncbi:MAG TPA: hypothetical protein VJB15_10695 [Rhodothermia bacterium]|nr:hypothetical protein [Rhodothermia bacterium]
MFVISQSETYTWPVRVEIPVDGGKFKTETFDGVFARLSRSKIQEILGREDSSDLDAAKELLKGWKGVHDDGGEIPFSESARDKILDVPLVASAVIKAWIESLGGKKKN